MGGVWERLIRSVRKILGALLTQQTVTDEGLATVMVEVESIMNSRLTPVVLDPDGEEPLAPNHLLLIRGSPNLPLEISAQLTAVAASPVSCQPVLGSLETRISTNNAMSTEVADATEELQC